MMTAGAPNVATVVSALSGVFFMGVVALVFRTPLARMASRAVERMRGSVGYQFGSDELAVKRWRLRFLALGVFALVLGSGSAIAWIATLLTRK